MKKQITTLGILGLFIILLMGFVSAESVENEDNISNQQNDQSEEPRIDIVFVIDSTGSMSDEIREVKMHIKNLISEISEGTPKPNMSIGFVTYRDYKDEEPDYLYKRFLLTEDIDEAIKNLEEIEAMYGGDYKEAVTVGLEVALNEMNWRVANGENYGYDEYQRPINTSNTSIKRMMFLIGDAPPRTKEYHGSGESVEIPPDYKDKIEDAKRKDIVIYTISGSGMDSEGVRIWKEIAEETGGKYEELTYERKNIQDYVVEEELDEDWIESVKNESDYDSYGGTILTNSFRTFVKSAVVTEAESMGVEFIETKEDLNDAYFVGDIGFFIDSENDGIFDTFFSNKTGSNTHFELQDNDTYLIDNNGDGTWDYTYNVMSDTIVVLGEKGEINEKETNALQEILWVVFIGLVVVVAIISVIVFLCRKKCL